MKNYYVAAAMRSIGAGAAGGVGEVMADYITKGHPPFDMYNLVRNKSYSDKGSSINNVSLLRCCDNIGKKFKLKCETDAISK